tara:strand:- start:8503 stop:8664 length:162 start_codon:yes stop_codon:yes gene_type:complete
MKILKVTSKSGNDKMQVITTAYETKHIRKRGDVWYYLAGYKANDEPIYKPIIV